MRTRTSGDVRARSRAAPAVTAVQQCTPYSNPLTGTRRVGCTARIELAVRPQGQWLGVLSLAATTGGRKRTVFCPLAAARVTHWASRIHPLRPCQPPCARFERRTRRYPCNSRPWRPVVGHSPAKHTASRQATMARRCIVVMSCLLFGLGRGEKAAADDVARLKSVWSEERDAVLIKGKRGEGTPACLVVCAAQTHTGASRRVQSSHTWNRSWSSESLGTRRQCLTPPLINPKY